MTGISDQVRDRMIEHLRNGTTDMAPGDLNIPVSDFSSDAHAAEERALFRRQPLIVAHASELPEPGSFVTRDVLGTALLIVRQADGSVATLLNMCRHRGGKVEMAEAGKKLFFVCGYHGWSYDRGGGLRGVPFEESFETIERSCRSLIPVRAEERHGFIWVTLDEQPGAGSVADFLGEAADAQLASFGIGDAVTYREESFPLDINWKLVMDGAIDILHPQFLHPNGVGKMVQTNVGVWRDYGRHGQLFTARRRLAELAKSGEPIEAAWRYFATNFVLYPNSMVIAAPDHIEFWTVWPSLTSASHSTTHIRFLVKPDILDETIAGRLDRSWRILQDAAVNEDWPMEAAIQANARANPGGTYLYGRSEVSCQHLHRQLRKDLAQG